MNEIKVNSDLLKCENDLFTKESQTKSLLITKSAKKTAITPQKPLKTEKICSSVLDRAKQFLDITKTDDNIADKCDLVDENDCEDDTNDGKQVIEMNLMLFERKKESNSESTDEDNESSTEETDSSSEESEDESSDSDQPSDHLISDHNKDQ